MQLRDLGLIGVALLAFGCSQPPKAVFVDLEQLAKQDLVEAVELPEIPAGKDISISPQIAILPKSSGVVILDRAAGKIELARELIEKDRENAIRTLSRRLATVRSEQIEVEKIKALEELRLRQAEYMTTVYAQLYSIFEKYAKERGPKFARADFLKYRRPDLYISRTHPTNFAQKQREEMEALRKVVAELDDEYNRQATRILDEAQIQLSSELGSVQAKYETLRANAIDQAERDARRAIERASASSDLNLGQNRSVVVSEVPGESVRVNGSSQSSKPISGLDPVQVVNASERRNSLEQQLEIWLKTRGFERAKVRSDGADATEEFDAWRKSHRVGH